MFQQSIEVSQPHMKPVLFKSSVISEISSEEDSVMPLEYFAAYEIELQETILQLNSELGSESEEDSSSDSADGDQDSPESDSEQRNSNTLSSLDNSSHEACEEPVGTSAAQVELQEKLSHEHQQSAQTFGSVNFPSESPSTMLAANEFGDYELELQKAVHELANLSNVLVRCILLR